MPNAEASVVVHAPPARVAALYRDFTRWPELFPATIRGVRLVRAEPGRTEVEVDHRREGAVVNVLTEVSPERVDLWESKRLYDGTFVNRFDPAPEGARDTLYTVRADIALKGAARLLGPILAPYVRRQIRRYVLEPVRRAAEVAESAAGAEGGALGARGAPHASSTASTR